MSKHRRRIYLMRHGDVTYFTDEGRPLKHEQLPLNENGRLQAKEAGKAFAAAQLHFDRVIASGLPRTIETAQLALNEIPKAENTDPEIEIWSEFQEIRNGDLSDIPKDRLRNAFTEFSEANIPEDRRFFGGESVGEFFDRILPALQRLRRDPSWGTALLVLHNGTNRAILSHAISGGRRAFFGNLTQSAGCINVLDVGEEPNDWVIRTINHSTMNPLQDGPRTTMMEELLLQYSRFAGA